MSVTDWCLARGTVEMSLIGAVLAYFFLEGTWRVVVIVALLMTDVVEIWIWLKWRKRRAMTGAEAMVGKEGTAVTDLNPEGTVKVMGQMWHGWCADRVDAGERVQVVGLEGLRLQVARR